MSNGPPLLVPRLDPGMTPERARYLAWAYRMIDPLAEVEARLMERQSKRWWLNYEHSRGLLNAEGPVDWPPWRVLAAGAAVGAGICMPPVTPTF